MYLLTDGKNYVMKNPMKPEEFIATTSSAMAERFQYKRARGILQGTNKKYEWMENYYILEEKTGKELKNAKSERSNKNIYMGDKDFDVDEKVFTDIIKEKDSILGLAGWNINQLITMKNQITALIGKYDSALSDIEHSLQYYQANHDGKKPAAHKMSKIAYLIEEIRIKRDGIKQSLRYVDVMINAINNKYTIEKIKLELSKCEPKEYKGRTKYYNLALDILND